MSQQNGSYSYDIDISLELLDKIESDFDGIFAFNNFIKIYIEALIVLDDNLVKSLEKKKYLLT